jgi:predicted Zn-dependent peptidase
VKTALAALFLCASLCADVRLPAYTREVLPNGVVVYLAQKAGLPLVDFRILVKGGMESEPPELPGLASVTAALLRRGTTHRTAEQFSEQLDFLGGQFNDYVDEQCTAITAEFLKKDFDSGVELLSDAILHPSFSPDEIKKLLARRADSIRAAKDNPQMAIMSYYRSFYFGPAHPYGRIADEASLDRIRRADIEAYHRRTYAGRNIVVIAAGDFDPAAARAGIGRAFGSAPEGSSYAWAKNSGESPSGRLLLIDKPDATQTYFIIAQPGIDRRSPDRVPLILVNTLFGGRFTSMLNQALRVDSGLSYGAHSVVQQSRMPGSLLISTFTKTESTQKAIDIALVVLKRIREQGVTAEQLASAKAYVKGTYPTQRLETADQVATVIGELELFVLGRDDVDQLFSKIDAVTLEQANAVARRYYRLDNLTFVLLGNAAKIRGAAAAYAPSMVERSVRQPGWYGAIAPTSSQNRARPN